MLLLATAGLLLPGERAHAYDSERLLASFMRHQPRNPQALRAWQDMMQESQSLPNAEKLQRVNGFFNRTIHFDDDQAIWGQSDYWATPLQTLARGAGDCEDFAVAKYFSLRLLGIPGEQLRLIYVRARIGGPASTVQQAHMVLAFYASPEAEPLVLDNLISEMRPASRRPDLQPVFSFNSSGIYAGVSGTTTAGPGGTGRLSKWQDLLQRARSEGLGFDQAR